MKLCDECFDAGVAAARQRERWKKRRLRATKAGLTLAEWALQNCLLLRQCQRLQAAQYQVIKRPKQPTLSKEQVAERYRRRYRTNPVYATAQRLKSAMRKHPRFGCLNTRLRDGLKRRRPSEVFRFLGYTPEDLAVHLKRQFARGMSWKAFLEGRIHIDHVVPIREFDLTQEDEVRRCWALTNLQPRWGADNLAKAARREQLL